MEPSRRQKITMKYRLHPRRHPPARMPAMRPSDLPSVRWTMYEECPGCGLDFDRGQPGYFTGAMYVSYALAIPLIALLTLIEHLMIPSWSLFRLVLLAWVICIPLIPWVWQYSRGDLDPLRSVGRPRGRRQPGNEPPPS